MTTEATPSDETPSSVDTITPEDIETSEHEENERREESRFKEGQILRFVRVRFPGNSRSFSFLVGKRTIEYGQKVVAMSDRGMAVGYVNSFPYDLPFNKSMLPVRSIAKVASEEDIVSDIEAYRQQKEAENICNDLIEDHKLDMHLTHVEFTSFGKKAIFYFIAPSRVDFRDLVKELVGKLKTRIELRQISVRDRSAAIGGIGPCGRELCCSSFLTKYGNVGIKMAKNQDLTLNFSKLNGVCGQLKCCLQYEDDVYREKRSKLPREGDYVETHTGEFGRVDRLHLLSEQFVMMTNRGVRRRYVASLYKGTVDRETAKFPNEFESISDETSVIIGLSEAEAAKVRAFEESILANGIPAKNFAEETFAQLFGEKTLDYSLPDILEPETEAKSKSKTVEDEEEISYTPSEDEILPEDDDSVIVANAYKAEQRDVVQHRRTNHDMGQPHSPKKGDNQSNAANRGQPRNDRNPRQNGGPNRQQGRGRPPR